MSALNIPAGPRWVSPEFWNAPQVEALKAKVHCHRDEAIDRKVVEQLLAGRWEKTHSRVVLKAAGRSFEAAADYAPGDPFQADLAFTDAQLFAKFRNSTGLGLPAAQIERCIETVMMLEREPDVRGLLQLLH
jgi:2-methylcitrate dehydratase PrpD